MRTVLAMILVLGFGVCIAWAKPGDIYKDGDKTLPENAQHMHSAAQLSLETIDGYVVKKLADGFLKATTFVSVGHDLYVLQPLKGTLWKLRDRDGDGIFESCAPYLVGFVSPTSLGANENAIFVADANGVWSIDIEPTLVATKTPILVISQYNQEHSIVSLTANPDNQSVYIGYNTREGRYGLLAYDLKAGIMQTPKFGGFGKLLELCTAPSGSRLALIHTGDKTALALLSVLKTQASNRAHFSRTEIGGCAVLNKTDSTDYPQNWQGTVLVALGGAFPMIASISYEYGGLSGSRMSIVEGFANRSARLGYANVYGFPVTIRVMDTGRIVFLDNKGTLWAIDKEGSKTKKKPVQDVNPKQPTVKPDPFRSYRDAILSGENKVQNKKPPPVSTGEDKDTNKTSD